MEQKSIENTLKTNIIKFYSRGTKHGEFSNLFLVDIWFEDRWWKSSEHCYQYHKFKEEYNDIAEWIITAPRPSTLAIAAHGFSKYSKYIKSNWKDINVSLMRKIVLAKFSQHDDLAKKLLETGDATLIEDSPYDSFWGIGAKGTGVNMLGKILMETREILRKEGKE